MLEIKYKKEMPSNNKIRELWIDDMKVIACVLVTLGHFFQSMVKSGIMVESSLYKWFNQTIYFFHVPLFFICSGYLYQQFSKVENIKSWFENIFNKSLILGIPYFIFSLITWELKTLFSKEVNSQLGSVIEVLFVRPMSPYWYLYCLFFIYVITITFHKKVIMNCMIIVAVFLKIISICGVGGYCIYAISSVMINEVWFVLGMLLSVINYQRILDQYYHKSILSIGLLSGIIFLILSICVYKMDIHFAVVEFLLGVFACVSILIMVSFYCKSKKRNILFKILDKYTLPIFLMHTIFAAAFRIILLKIGITNAMIHIVLGIGISFIGPILTAIGVEGFHWINFLLYPGKYIKIKFT